MRYKQVFLALCVSLFATAAQATDYPIRPVTIIVPFGAGSGPDVIARLVAAKLSVHLGQPAVVENRPGAGGTIGAGVAARAEPDGYTLLMASTSTHVVAPALYAKLPYDPLSSFAPVTQLARGAFILVVRSDLSVNNLQEFLAHAKKNPDKLNYASSGMGSLHHLGTEMLKRAAAIEMTHVPFRGSADSWMALQTGTVDVVFDGGPGPSAALQSGKGRAIAVTGSHRLAGSPGLPDLRKVPTFIEQGVEGVDVFFWYGIMAPTGAPKEVLAKLDAGLTASLKEPDVVRKFNDLNTEVASGTPDDFAKMIARELARYREIVVARGITPN